MVPRDTQEKADRMAAMLAQLFLEAQQKQETALAFNLLRMLDSPADKLAGLYDVCERAR